MSLETRPLPALPQDGVDIDDAAPFGSKHVDQRADDHNDGAQRVAHNVQVDASHVERTVLGSFGSRTGLGCGVRGSCG
jgi:hypothetical protein